MHQLTENSFGSRQGGGSGELRSLFVWMSLANVTSRREKCHFLRLVFLDTEAFKWFLPEQNSADLTSLSEKASEMCIKLKNKAYESCKQFRTNFLWWNNVPPKFACSHSNIASLKVLLVLQIFFAADGNGFFVPMRTVNTYKHQFSAYKCY